MTVEPLAVYGFGSDPHNDELPDGDIFGPYAADDEDAPPLGLLLYGRRPPDVEDIEHEDDLRQVLDAWDQLTGDLGSGARLSDLIGEDPV